MRVLKVFGSLIGASVFWVQAAFAGDMALILGDTGQIATLRNETAITSVDFAGPLREAGFEIVQPTNRSSGNMRLAAQRIEAALSENAVDRLVIVVMGPIARSGRESWALSNGAAGATSLNVGVSGISLGALSDMAAAAKGRAAILIAPGREVETLGNGLSAGLGDLNEAQDVTYVVGPAVSLVAVVTGGLLDAGTSFAELARTAPADVEMSGFVSEETGLMRQTAAEDAAAAKERGFWAAVRTIDSRRAYFAYLDAYPGGAYESEVAERLHVLQSEPERRASAAEEAMNLTSEERRAIQGDLAQLGFDPRGVDGVFGLGSRAAISAWQRDQGLEETGFIDDSQLSLLRNAAAARARESEAEENRLQREQEEREEQDRADQDESGPVAGDEAGPGDEVEVSPDDAASDTAQVQADEIEEAPQVEPTPEESEAWNATLKVDDIQAYEKFLEDFPDGQYALAAQDRLRKLSEIALNADFIRQAKTEEKQVAGLVALRLVVEQRLVQIGEKPGAVDGKFDKRTRRAIRLFQQSRNLPVTGYISRLTMAQLMAEG